MHSARRNCAGTRAKGQAGAGEPRCGYDAAGAVGAAMRSQAAQQQPVVDASDALYPNIYPSSIAPGTTAEQYKCLSVPRLQGPPCRNVTLNDWRATIRSTVGQALRSAKASPANGPPTSSRTFGSTAPTQLSSPAMQATTPSTWGAMASTRRCDSRTSSAPTGWCYGSILKRRSEPRS